MSNSTRPAFEINKSLMSPGVVLLFVGFFLKGGRTGFVCRIAIQATVGVE